MQSNEGYGPRINRLLKLFHKVFLLYSAKKIINIVPANRSYLAILVKHHMILWNAADVDEYDWNESHEVTCGNCNCTSVPTGRYVCTVMHVQ